MSKFLSNAGIEHSLRVSVLAPITSSEDSYIQQSTNDDFLSTATYKQLASVLRQCKRTSVLASSACLMKFATSSAEAVSYSSRGRNNGPRKLSNSALSRLRCHACGRYGH